MFSLCESAWVCMCLHVYTTWMFYWDVAVWETSKTSRRPALNHLNTRFISRGAKVVRDATNKTQLKWINHDVREACVLKSHERPLKALKIDESVNQICCNLLLRWLTLHKCLPMTELVFRRFNESEHSDSERQHVSPAAFRCRTHICNGNQQPCWLC